MSVSDKIAEQQSIYSQIKDLQAKEKELRLEILDELFGDNNVGTVKTQVSNLIVTGTYGLTYKFAQAEIDEAIETGALSTAALSAINVKYELNKKAYDQLDEEATSELNDYLTITPALPTLKVKADGE